jgi:hypothetical protein
LKNGMSNVGMKKLFVDSHQLYQSKSVGSVQFQSSVCCRFAMLPNVLQIGDGRAFQHKS